jgi:E2F/DP family winged-helix DNA-binding domain
VWWQFFGAKNASRRWDFCAAFSSLLMNEFWRQEKRGLSFKIAPIIASVIAAVDSNIMSTTNDNELTANAAYGDLDLASTNFNVETTIDETNSAVVDAIAAEAAVAAAAQDAAAAAALMDGYPIAPTTTESGNASVPVAPSNPVTAAIPTTTLPTSPIVSTAALEGDAVLFETSHHQEAKAEAAAPASSTTVDPSDDSEALASAVAAAAAVATIPPQPIFAQQPPPSSNTDNHNIDDRPSSQSMSGGSKSRQPHVLTDSQGNAKTFGSALGLLTRKFMDMLQSSNSGTLDMNDSALKLGVPKRRIYDITNVLEGVGIIEKKSKNTVAWKGSEAILGSALDQTVKEQLDQLRGDIGEFQKEEAMLDQWIAQLAKMPHNHHQSLQHMMDSADILEALFYPVSGSVHQLSASTSPETTALVAAPNARPTKDDLVDETGKPRRALLAVHAPYDSIAYIPTPGPGQDDQNKRQLYIGTRSGLDKYGWTVAEESSTSDVVAAAAAAAAAATPGGVAGETPTTGIKRNGPIILSSRRGIKMPRPDDKISVFLMPTYYDDKDQKIKTTGIQLLSDDPYTLAAQAAAASAEQNAAAAAGDGLVAAAAEGGDDGGGGSSSNARPASDVVISKRSSSWDVAESMANDEGVSQFFEGGETEPAGGETG